MLVNSAELSDVILTVVQFGEGIVRFYSQSFGVEAHKTVHQMGA